MSFSTVIVTGRYESADGPARGTVTFTRSALLRDSATGEWWLPTPLVAHLDSEGVLRVPLIANNDPTTVPTGSTYTVQEAAGDCTRTYSITVPYNQPNGILDLIDVATGSIPGAVSLAAVTGGTGGGGGGGGAGSLTPPVTIGPTPALLDGDTSTYPLVVSAAVDATNDQATTMIVGNADPAYGLDGLDAYSGSSYALYGRSTSGAGVRAISTSGAGLSASSESGVGITAAAASGAGVTGISTSNTGVRGNSATQDGIQGAGGRYGGYFTGAVAALCAGGAIEVRPATEPDTTPGSGIGYLYLDSADNTAKVKTDDGTVGTLGRLEVAQTWTAPQTVHSTDAVQAPLNVVQSDTGTTTAPNVLALTHSLSSGTADVGLGAGLAFRLQRDDDTVRVAAALVAQWLDAGGLGELRITAYDDTTPYTLRIMPTGVFMPNASAEPALPINGGVLYVESGTLKYKGSSGTVTTLGAA